jgi:adenylate cyclase
MRSTSEENANLERSEIAESEIRATLKRVLESAEFARSKRMKEFLSFVVEEALSGRGDRLKAFPIAVEVYGRDETFNSSTDAVVRMQAGRLRSRLDRYFETAGRNDSVRISLHKGSYNPIFSLNTKLSPSSTISTVHNSRRRVAIGIGIIAILMLSIFSGWLLLSEFQPLHSVVAEQPVESLSPKSAPFLAVLPFATFSDDPMEDRLASGLVEEVIADLAKLSKLSVMAHASLLSLNTPSIDIHTIRRNFGATHVLRGNLKRENTIVSVNVQLIDTSSYATIWAKRLEVSSADNLLDLTGILTERIADQLEVQVTPEERNLIAHRHTNNPEVLALYRQALVLLIPPNEMERILTARNMFRRTTEIDPKFAGGYAGEGFSHSITVLFLKAANPADELQKGIGFALKAIEKDPEFGMGYVSLAFAYALSGRQQEALFNAKKAITVQPGDAFTQFVFGMTLILSGSPIEAVAPLSNALRLDPVEPRTPYRNVLGIAYYTAGEYTEAVRIFEENISIGGPRGPHMDAFRASAFAELGSDREAKSIIDELVKSYPDFPVDSWLQKWLGDGAHLPRKMENLYRLGLPRKPSNGPQQSSSVQELPE